MEQLFMEHLRGDDHSGAMVSISFRGALGNMDGEIMARKRLQCLHDLADRQMSDLEIGHC
jgi:hypothetical protein